MERRDAIKRATLVMGGIMSSGTIMAIMHGCKAEPKINWSPSYFDQGQAAFINSFVEVLIPAGENTPAAVEVGVPGYIDDVVGVFWNEEEKEKLKMAMADFDQSCQDNHGKPFAKLDVSEQKKALESIAKPQSDVEDEEFDLFNELKGLALSGYFSSEYVGKNVLKYVPVPNEQKGCISLEEATGGLPYSI